MPTRLTAARVRGYRGIADTRIEFHTDRTSIVGERGSGKSSMLDAIGLVGGMLRYLDPLSPDLLHRGSSEISLDLEMLIRGRKVTYGITLAPTPAAAALVVTREVLEDEDGICIERDHASARCPPECRDDYTFPIETPRALVLMQQAMLWGAHHRLAAPCRLLAGIRVYNPTPHVMHAINPGGLDRRGRGLLAILAKMSPREQQEFREEGVPLDPASDGELMDAWTLLLALEASGTLLIDEPAQALGAYAAQRRASWLKTASTRSQVIIATHSAGLVSEFSDPDGVYVMRQGQASPLMSLPGADEAVMSIGLGEAAMCYTGMAHTP